MGLAAYASLPAVKMDWATGREHEVALRISAPPKPEGNLSQGFGCLPCILKPQTRINLPFEDRWQWSSSHTILLHVDAALHTSHPTLQRQKTTHKIVADCMEALIGAFYITGGEKGASAYMRHIGLLPKMPGTAYQLPEPDRSAASPSARHVVPPPFRRFLLGCSLADWEACLLHKLLR